MTSEFSRSHHADTNVCAGARPRAGRCRTVSLSACALLTLSGALAQNGPTIVSFGPLSQPVVAPGDIITLQIVGLKTVLPSVVKATGTPLPTELAGISVAFRRLGINLPGPPVAVPLFSIEQTRLCTDELLRPPPPTECLLTSITVQVPLFGAIPVGDHGGFFAISEDGVTSKLFYTGGSLVNVHVLTACARISDGSCGAVVPAVTHTNGSLVTASSPAKAGEVVVIYATGLGSTIVPVGQASPAPAARLGTFYLQFDFSPNARPRFPERAPFSPPRGPTPEFVGLTPGQVGLYQINVRIPEPIPPVTPCRVDATEGVNVISNLTITVATTAAPQYNSDGAAICVTPSQ